MPQQLVYATFGCAATLVVLEHFEAIAKLKHSLRLCAISPDSSTLLSAESLACA